MNRNDFSFRRMQRIVESNVFKGITSSKPDYDDPILQDFISRFMDPPSQRQRKFSNNDMIISRQLKVLEQVMNVSKGGFFVECGANDGERNSNSDYLETVHKWAGFLAEPDISFYTQLIGKNRRAWSINAGLSPDNFTSLLTYTEDSYGAGNVIGNLKGQSKYSVPCFTLHALMYSLNVTTIDFFSLDVEGVELGVLKTIDFSKINIRTLTVEFLTDEQRVLILNFLTKNGFKLYQTVVGKYPFAHDLFFVNENLSL